MIWVAGTVASNNIKSILEAWLTDKFKEEPYVSRLPDRHIVICSPTSTKKIWGSILVRLYTEGDDKPPHEYTLNGNQVLEEFHKVTIDVSSNEEGADVGELITTATVIRQLLTSKEDREELSTLGLNNISDSQEHAKIDGVEFSNPKSFFCNTDTYI